MNVIFLLGEILGRQDLNLTLRGEETWEDEDKPNTLFF